MGSISHWRRLAACAALGLGVETVSAQTDFSVVTGELSTWNQSDWSLTSTVLTQGQYQARLSLSNGYVGASLSQAGPFFEKDVNQSDSTGTIPINGWPLFDERLSFSTISGFFNVQQNTTGSNYPWLYQYGYDSFIAGIPHPTAIIFSFGEQYLDATVKNETISNFSSKISFKTGVGEWSYTWAPENTGASFNVTYTALFSRARPNVIAVKADIVPSASIDGTVTDLLDGQSAYRAYVESKGLDDNGTTIYSSLHPLGLANITGVVVSGVDFSNAYTNLSSRASAEGAFLFDNETTIGQTFDISLVAGETATFFKYVGVASTDKFPDPFSTARSQQAEAQSAGWDTLLAEHVEAWGEILTDDSVDDFRDPETGELPEDPTIEILQISSVANPYYLLQSMQPDGSGLNDDGIAVGGLVSDSYAGQTFWDMDYWMAPGLNLAFPSWAKQITNFRVKQHPQALANAEFNGFPEGSALYSWTAGKYGNCTGTGPCVDYQYHLNHDIAFNIFQLNAVIGNQSWFEDGPLDVINSAAIMTSHLLEFNETTGTYWIYNMTDPDEYANNIDNGAFTMGSSSKLLSEVNALYTAQGQSVNQTWIQQGENIEFPKAESSITLEYTGMNNSAAVKQADIVLLTYPLDFTQNYSASDKLLDLDYYANKQSPDGPAMTYSIFAINANALSPSGCSAYTYTLNGLLPYLRGPWYQFSEQQIDDVTRNGGTNPAFPFLTGSGGANQIVPFGFLGVRTDQPVLYLDPSLPPQIPQVRVRTIHYGGASLSAFINQTHTVLTRLETPSSKGFVDSFANTTFPFMLGQPSTSEDAVSYNISIGESLTLPNRLYWQNLTVTGNLLQCLPISSEDAYAAGQFPVAVNDGATSTKWQPLTNDSASLLVNTTSLASSQPISGIFIDWAGRPPRSATVYIGNSTSDFETGDQTVISLGEIQPSLAFNATASALSPQNVVPVEGNTTSIDVQGAWTGQFVRLVVEGCWEEDGEGSTVSEFVLLGASEDGGDNATATVTAVQTSIAPTATGTAPVGTATSNTGTRGIDVRGVRTFASLFLMLLGVGFV
ncbi:acid trehalase [Phlyctema vagabunda]|uniref:alpha,alpha-trehalase n=1 Tax=Phlyctema vagabunda TaxID=108571 RepID=A0ABR4PMI3_9HELO